jgi:hypothetical protein
MPQIKFRVEHDNAMDIVDKISAELYTFRLTINKLEGADGWVEYQIEVIK